jgi:hypothetical protein
MACLCFRGKTATDENKGDQSNSKITGLDIFKNVGAALLIAFLVYRLPILAEQVYSPAEIRWRGDLAK